jgi:hypothetical protein
MARQIPNEFWNLLNQACMVNDLRIGQLFDNLKYYAQAKGLDMFQVENDKLTELLQEYLS